MPEMQKEIHSDSQHCRARQWEGEMPKMRQERTGTTHCGFSGKDFEQELARLERKFQMPKVKWQGDERCFQKRC
jgi:hypothetical protein